MLPPFNLSPADLGLPSKFPTYRPIQLRSVSDGINATTQFIAQTLPTGSGKTLSNVTQGVLAGRAAYLTATKALQKQTQDDFFTCGMADVKGRNNYTCSYGASANTTCEDGMHMGCKAHRDGACDYVNHLLTAKASNLPNTNYAYWMAVNKYGEGLGPVDLLICDEADAVVDQVCNLLTVELSNRDLHALQLKPPADADTDLDAWRSWTDKALPEAQKQLDKAKAGLQRDPNDRESLRLAKSYSQLVQRLTGLQQLKGKWIVDCTYDHSNGVSNRTGWRFDPVWPADYMEDLLWCGSPRVLLTSASLNRKICTKWLGIDPTCLTYYEYPSDFDPARGPVVWVKTGVRVDRRMSELDARAWISRIDQILRLWPNQKGVIHCTSYERSKDIFRLSSERRRLLFHNSWNTADKLEEFMSKPPESGAVLLTPAMTTGVDLADDLCRFQIIAKVPMADTRSKVMKARIAEDPDYGDNQTAQAVQQACGRPVRNPKDWCITYVTDDHWAWWWPKVCGKGLVTQGFRRRVIAPSDGIPLLRF